MKLKSLLTGILIGSVALPTLVVSGSFASSLIQGKSPAEAAQVLSEQINSLIGRVEKVETKQAKQEQAIQKLEESISQPFGTSSPAEPIVPTKPSVKPSSPNSRSRGVITIYNELDHPMKVGDGTRLINEEATLTFRLTESIEVPSQGSIVTTIQSDEKLESSQLLKCSNEQPCIFRIAGFMGLPSKADLYVYGKSFSNFEPINE